MRGLDSGDMTLGGSGRALGVFMSLIPKKESPGVCLSLPGGSLSNEVKQRGIAYYEK